MADSADTRSRSELRDRRAVIQCIRVHRDAICDSTLQNRLG
jgi:hypothetical protein